MSKKSDVEFIYALCPYLTRKDIAQILKVSPKQAGRLMCDMPFLQVSKHCRRVAAKDFEAWCDAKRVTPANAVQVSNPSLRSASAPKRIAPTGAIVEAARSKMKGSIATPVREGPSSTLTRKSQINKSTYE